MRLPGGKHLSFCPSLTLRVVLRHSSGRLDINRKGLEGVLFWIQRWSCWETWVAWLLVFCLFCLQALPSYLHFECRPRATGGNGHLATRKGQEWRKSKRPASWVKEWKIETEWVILGFSVRWHRCLLGHELNLLFRNLRIWNLEAENLFKTKYPLFILNIIRKSIITVIGTSFHKQLYKLKNSLRLLKSLYFVTDCLERIKIDYLRLFCQLEQEGTMMCVSCFFRKTWKFWKRSFSKWWAPSEVGCLPLPQVRWLQHCPWVPN